MLVNSRLFHRDRNCPLQVRCYNHPNNGAPFKTNTCLLTQQTSNGPNTWAEAMYEEGLCDGGVVCSV